MDTMHIAALIGSAAAAAAALGYLAGCLITRREKPKDAAAKPSTDGHYDQVQRMYHHADIAALKQELASTKATLAAEITSARANVVVRASRYALLSDLHHLLDGLPNTPKGWPIDQVWGPVIEARDKLRAWDKEWSAGPFSFPPNVPVHP